jgi:hypothetical protein
LADNRVTLSSSFAVMAPPNKTWRNESIGLF